MSQMETKALMLGKWQTLKVINLTGIGAYLGHEETNKVLLPKKQVPQGTKAGDQLEVFLYKDSSDRLIATTNHPLLTRGEIAVLKVKQVTRIGAFLDWGLEKDLFLPFGQQNVTPQEGFYYPVALYVDKSERLAATMWIDKYLEGDLDDKRKQKSLLRMQADSENVYVQIKKKGGYLDYNDKADPDRIEQDFHLSKNAFKRAVGVLYKAHRLIIGEDYIELT